jgi:hypothetical protein
MTMTKPTLGLAVLLMLGGTVVAHAQDRPGDRLEGPAQGLERGPASDAPSGDEIPGGDGPRGDGPGDAAIDAPKGAPGGDDAGPRAEGPNPDARKGAPEGERSGAERADRSRDGETSPDVRKGREKSTDEGQARDRKGRAETKERADTEDKASDKDKARDKAAQDTKGEGKRDTEAKSDDDTRGDRSRTSPGEDAAESDKAKPAEDGKQAAGDRKPPEEVKKADLSGEKRERVGSAFREARDVKRRTDVDIHISVGTRLPRDWDFVPVPVAVVDVVPEYRGYVFAYVDDEYVICDPVTYEVVAVLPASGGGGPRYAGGGDGGADRCSESLTLTEEEREDILRSIQMADEVDVSNITVGWSVPGEIELRTFPEPVVARAGKLAACRYFVAEDQVAIVDPVEETVVLLIDQE